MTTQKFDKWMFEKYDTQNGLFAVRVYNTNAKKEWNSLKYHYSFKTVSARQEWIDQMIKNVQSRIDDKNKRMLERKSFVNPAKVGDILIDSWGYDQTNVDFFQVTKVIGKMIEFRAIGCKRLEDSYQSHGMACNVVPVKDKFIGEQTYKKLVKPNYNSEGYHVNTRSFNYAYLTTETEAHYESWYA